MILAQKVISAKFALCFTSDLCSLTGLLLILLLLIVFLLPSGEVLTGLLLLVIFRRSLGVSLGLLLLIFLVFLLLGILLSIGHVFQLFVDIDNFVPQIADFLLLLPQPTCQVFFELVSEFVCALLFGFNQFIQALRMVRLELMGGGYEL